MKGKRILIADGDAELCCALATRLVAEQYEVGIAPDAVQGVHGCRTLRPHLVILGLELPGGGGILVHEQLKRTGQATVPIIYLAGPADGPTRDRARALGPAALVDRPVNIDLLMATVQQLVESPADRAEAMQSGGSRNLLLVVDDEATQDELQRSLTLSDKDTADIVVARTRDAAIRLIGEYRYDGVLITDRLADGPGLDVLAACEDELLTTPVVAVVDAGNPERMVRYFRAGCTEVVTVNALRAPDEFARSVSRAFGRFRQRRIAFVVENRSDAAADRTAADARADANRGNTPTLSTRRTFDEYHTSFHARCEDRSCPYVLAIIDVDHMADYNARYGRSAGDDLLRSVGEIVTAGLRKNDFIARYADDSFIVLFDDGIPSEDLARVTDRLRSRVTDRGIRSDVNPPYGTVTVSVGVAAFAPGVSETAVSVLLRADDALDAAQRDGGNSLIVAAPRPAKPSTRCTPPSSKEAA